MRDYFYTLADKFFATKSSEVLLLNFDGEQSDFCRLTKAKIRQSGHVNQSYCSLKLIDNGRQVSRTMTCSGDLAADLAMLKTSVQDMRSEISLLPIDTYLIFSESKARSEQLAENRLPRCQDVISQCLERVADLDFVGIYAQGAIYKGFASSFGQRNWYQSFTFNFDWSVYLRSDKAVKQYYAGTEWVQETFDSKIKEARDLLPLLAGNARSLKPGKYRAFLSPMGTQEIVDLWNWGGFSKKAQATRTAPFAKFYLGESTLSPHFSLAENSFGSLSPGFNSDGFLLPDNVSLVENGEFKNSLVSPRSAQEFGLQLNAQDSERIVGFTVDGGHLEDQDILKTLDTGLLINNLWYLNYSDRMAGRVTGMTRFACFWVEKGEIIAPLNVMRFDDSFSHMLGSGLEAVTRKQESILDSSSYGSRSIINYRLPGLLINDFQLVL